MSTLAVLLWALIVPAALGYTFVLLNGGLGLVELPPALVPVLDPASWDTLTTVLFKTTPIWLLAVTVAVLPKHDGYTLAVLAGLLLSSVGDVALVLDDAAAATAGGKAGGPPFLIGLVAFLIAHVAYVAAFGIKPLQPLYALVPGAYLALYLGGVILPALALKQHDELVGPVLAYGVVIGSMFWRALAATGNAAQKEPAVVAVVAAFFFIVSDSVLSYHIFVAKFPGSSAIVMATYYVAQALFAVAASKKSYAAVKEGRKAAKAAKASPAKESKKAK